MKRKKSPGRSVQRMLSVVNAVEQTVTDGVWKCTSGATALLAQQGSLRLYSNSRTLFSIENRKPRSLLFQQDIHTYLNNGENTKVNLYLLFCLLVWILLSNFKILPTICCSAIWESGSVAHVLLSNITSLQGVTVVLLPRSVNTQHEWKWQILQMNCGRTSADALTTSSAPQSGAICGGSGFQINTCNSTTHTEWRAEESSERLSECGPYASEEPHQKSQFWRSCIKCKPTALAWVGILIYWTDKLVGLKCWIKS